MSLIISEDPEILLDDKQSLFATEAGAKRNKFARSHGIKDAKIDDGSGSIEIDVLGAKAEFGYLLEIGKDPYTHPSMTEVNGPDAGWDDVFNGKRIQIKSTRYKTGVLMLSPKQIEKAKTCYDFLVLVIVSGNHVRIAGYVSTNEFIAKSKESNKAWRTGGRVMDQDQLHSFNLFTEGCR